MAFGSWVTAARGNAAAARRDVAATRRDAAASKRNAAAARRNAAAPTQSYVQFAASCCVASRTQHTYIRF